MAKFEKIIYLNIKTRNLKYSMCLLFRTVNGCLIVSIKSQIKYSKTYSKKLLICMY